MKTIFRLFFTILIIINYNFSFGQSYQTVRGSVSDKFTEATIPGVEIKILKDGKVLMNTLSNENGVFNIGKIELGTYDILFNHIQYKSFISPGVEISVSKEIVMDIVMELSVKSLTEVEVTPPKLRGQPVNEMATTSSYSIQADDAKRIAGGLDDPIRVAGTLPGVTSATGFSENFISIRGNSPRSLKYIMEGIELPNPTHFSRIGSAGGTFTIFSLQLLDKSDFYTGAFSAQYGNALGGVFDAKFRKGNNQKHEHIIQAGVLGLDIASEGPLSKSKKASYAINYRFGLVGLARLIGYPTQPIYQDLSFTLNFPLTNRSNLKLFAIGGTSLRDRLAEKDSSLWEESIDRTNLILRSEMGSFGAVFKHFLTDQTVFKATAAISYTKQIDNKQYLTNDYSTIDQRTNEYKSMPISFATSLKHKFNKRHFHITGLSFANTFHDWRSSRYKFNSQSTIIPFNGSGVSNELQAYTLSKFILTNRLNLNLGVHYTYYDVNSGQAIEPRVSIDYKLNPRHSLSASFGMHSQIEHFATYWYTDKATDSNLHPNKNLEFAKSNHYILGYKGKVWTNHSLRIEAYYQQLNNVPIDLTGTFSTINMSELQEIRLLNNNGTGANYGLDIGFERYTENGLYYIFNGSVYRSLYTGSDNIQRSTAYDNQYNIKLLIGKEYKLKEKGGKYKAFAWNTNLSMLGGAPYTPVDLAASEIEQETIYNEAVAFSERDDALVFLDFTFSYKINSTKRRSVWALQIKNLFSNGNAIYREYDTVTKEEVIIPSSSVFPVISYRLEF
ncbi:MAG: carboxypeptidase regulatory-like domain-containing protein [Crocinitomicaceae bacterium]